MATKPALISIAWIAARCLIAAVFLYAGAMKAWDPAQFSSDLQGYRLLPAGAIPLVALYIPWLEIFSGAGLFVRPLRAGAWAIALVLSLGFVVFLGSAWARGLDVSCGCFGSTAASPIGPVAVGRAGLLAAISAAGLCRDRPRTCPDEPDTE